MSNKAFASNCWRVMLNPSRWNQAKYENDFYERPELRRLAQSKGMCRMIYCPKKGDLVSFVLKGKIIMKGIVDSDGFQTGLDHQEDASNIGDFRIHAMLPEFCAVNITEVGLSEKIRFTGQRTWAKMPQLE